MLEERVMHLRRYVSSNMMSNVSVVRLLESVISFVFRPQKCAPLHIGWWTISRYEAVRGRICFRNRRRCGYATVCVWSL